MDSDSVADLAAAGLELSYIGYDGRPKQADEAVLRQLAAAILAPGDNTPPEPALVLRLGRHSPPHRTEFGSYRLIPAEAEEPARRAIIAPPIAYQLPACCDGHRLWLIAVQLYGIRSTDNWGHGDFGDLSILLRLAAAHGAAGIGLNPLHALFSCMPEDCSPYAPSSRVFLNPLYIQIADVPGFNPADLDERRDAIAALRQEPLIDYARVAALKSAALQAAYRRFIHAAPPDLQADFDRFRTELGMPLRRFAVFELLCHRFGRHWRQWPAPWQRPTDRDLAILHAEAGPEIEYFEFLQWQAHRQLAACQAEAKRLGLPIGLYLDFAVGVHPDGFDVWNTPDAFITEASVGAPPDQLNRSGQNWGLACFNPRTLQRTDYAAFRQALRASMRFAGALRYDHVLGVNRLYLIPFGAKADNGAYLRLPMEEFLAVMACESVMQECLLIGEDLGTVPEGFRERLSDWGLWTYLVLLFARDEDGAFQDVTTFPSQGLITFNTHDLPSYAGWWEGRDLDVMRELGLVLGESDADRAKAREALVTALKHAGLLQKKASKRSKPDFSTVAHLIARSPCGILSLGLDDILGMEEQQNLPGTWREYPNWRRRMSIDLAALAKLPMLQRVATALAQADRAWPPGNERSLPQSDKR